MSRLRKVETKKERKVKPRVVKLTKAQKELRKKEIDAYVLECAEEFKKEKSEV